MFLLSRKSSSFLVLPHSRSDNCLDHIFLKALSLLVIKTTKNIRYSHYISLNIFYCLERPVKTIFTRDNCLISEIKSSDHPFSRYDHNKYVTFIGRVFMLYLVSLGLWFSLLNDRKMLCSLKVHAKKIFLLTLSNK